jgi:hypothetical protein
MIPKNNNNTVYEMIERMNLLKRYDSFSDIPNDVICRIKILAKNSGKKSDNILGWVENLFFKRAKMRDFHKNSQQKCFFIPAKPYNIILPKTNKR